MTDLATAVSDYLTVRRALGHRLERAEKLLGQFVAYCDEVGATTITAEVAVVWATLPVHARPGWYGQRLSVVRRFAAWLQTLEATTVVPPADSLGPNPIRRAVPYLYTEAETTALMDAAVHLRYPLAQCTYRTLVGLLAVSGMRVGEAIRLDRGDVSWDDGQLRVERSKFNKSRYIVLHPSSLQALRVYADRRDELCPRPKSSSFFLSSAGTRLLYRNVCSLFGKMVRRAGLQPRSERCRPRLHDYADVFVMPTWGLSRMRMSRERSA